METQPLLATADPSLILGFDGIYYLLRWLHYFFGIIWIGLLYYLNFVHGAFMAEIEAPTKSVAVRQLLPKALWWFRWGAAFTFLTGIAMLYLYPRGNHELYTSTSWGIWILLGSLLGSIMAFNVWFVIWPAQKVVIASATTVASGGAADPRAANKASRALTASRTNVLFSIPMLFFMGAASHLGFPVYTAETAIDGVSPSNVGLVFAVNGLIIAALWLNALVGKPGPLQTVKGVITAGFLLAVTLYLTTTGLI